MRGARPPELFLGALDAASAGSSQFLSVRREDSGAMYRDGNEEGRDRFLARGAGIKVCWRLHHVGVHMTRAKHARRAIKSAPRVMELGCAI